MASFADEGEVTVIVADLDTPTMVGIGCFGGSCAAALGVGLVTYSYTQLAQYLACPLRYRYRYLDGWQEKETRAGLLFGRAFEQALAALFRREDPGCALFEAWSHYKNASLEYPKSETWDQMLEQRDPLAHTICPG